MSSTEKFDQWCIVELFGHQRIAGKVTEQAVGGCNFVRVDVPAIGDRSAFTKLFGNGAIYAMSPVTEEIALSMAKQISHAPVSPFEIPELRRLQQSMPSDADETDDDFMW